MPTVPPSPRPTAGATMGLRFTRTERTPNSSRPGLLASHKPGAPAATTPAPKLAISAATPKPPWIGRAPGQAGHCGQGGTLGLGSRKPHTLVCRQPGELLGTPNEARPCDGRSPTPARARARDRGGTATPAPNPGHERLCELSGVTHTTPEMRPHLLSSHTPARAPLLHCCADAMHHVWHPGRPRAHRAQMMRVRCLQACIATVERAKHVQA